MKRLISVLLVLGLLMGCGRKTLTPSPQTRADTTIPAVTAQPTAIPNAEPASPAAPKATVRLSLATFAPTDNQPARFPEELLSTDGEPIASLIRFLLTENLSKTDFLGCFTDMIERVDRLDEAVLNLSNAGRTLTADRREKTVNTLMKLISSQTQDAIQAVYGQRAGDGEDLPLKRYADAMAALIQNVERMEDRTVPFFALGPSAAKDYLSVLNRYMGEPVVPRTLFSALEELAQTEAYAISTALNADPEAARKKEPISLGSFEDNAAFLCRVTEELCPLPDGASLPVPTVIEAAEDMDLMELAFRLYPGMAFLKVYADHSPEAQQARWANAPDGYLAGLAVHCSYAVVPFLGDFGLDYVQYRWYEDMLTVTMTGISSLLIHYYGYSEEDLREYLKAWGAEDFADYLYEKAMSDPFESLAASYGYYRYLNICEAALDAGCPSEERFLQDYLAAGPAPFKALEEYMVGLYGNQG